MKIKISEGFDLIRNGASIQQEKIQSGIPITRIETIADGKIDMNRLGYASIQDDSFKDFYLEDGDILMSHINSISHLGKVAIFSDSDKKIIHGMNLLCLKVNRKILNPKFAYYYFKNPIFKSTIKKITKKSVNQASFNISSLKELTIPAPPLKDQIHISNILSKAEALIAQRKESLRLLDEFLTSTFLEMFGKNTKWRTKLLEDITAPGRIVTYGIVQAGPHVEGGIPYIKTGDIKNGRIEKDRLSRTSSEIAQAYKRSEVNKGDIVMSIRATVGTVALLPDELDGANLTQGTARISSGPEVHRLYLYYYFKSDQVQRWISKQVKGATFREITLSKLRQLPVMIPPLDRQIKFAHIVEKTEALKAHYQTSLQELENLYGSLSQRAFKGELNLKGEEPDSYRVSMAAEPKTRYKTVKMR